MAASATTTPPTLLSSFENLFLQQDPPMLLLLFLFLFFTFSLLSFSILISSLYYNYYYYYTTTKTKVFVNTNNTDDDKLSSKSLLNSSQSQTHLTHSLLLENLPSNSPKWATLFNEKQGDDPVGNGSGMNEKVVDSERGENKKKKRRVKKKRGNPKTEEEEKQVERVKNEKRELVCLYPFTSSSSATQRKIKQQYDQLVKSHESNGLTLAQVGHFVNVLTEARNELQHKSGVIQRKYTITKALLYKADRSSFDRLRQQIYKLELEQKRLEEDVYVYNWLQQQLKLSPAYKRMLEIGACMELKAKNAELEDSTDTEFADISFEELLAKEKKDSFWQKKGKPKSCTGS